MTAGRFGMAAVNRRSLRSAVLVAALYAALAAGLLAPLAANTVLPDAYDVPNHVAMIVQARAAIEEGQFPLRVAPRDHTGWRYPLFQFYSPLPYTLAGLLYKIAVPHNPYLAYKVILLVFLVVGGLFVYRLSVWLVGSRAAALLAGALYMAAPYGLINIHARAAFTEAVAQGLLAVVVYYGCRCYASPRRRFLLAAALSWCALALTHLITFLCAIVFLGLLFGLLGGRGSRAGRRAARPAIALAWGIVLALPALAPAVAAPYLRIHHPGYLVNPYSRSWLTPLFGLLSPVSVSPEPLPGHDYGTPHLHPAVGWPMLVAAGVVLQGLLGGRTPPQPRRGRGLAGPLLAVFGAALFVTWSPFDFWSWLPSSFHVPQFSYRFLTHVMWTGALLAAIALTWMFGRRLDARHVAVGLLLIGLSSGSYLPSPRASRVTIQQLVEHPEIGPAGETYLPRQDSFAEVVVPGLTLRPVAETQRDCRQTGATTSCLVSVPARTLAQLPVLFYPDLLHVTVDGRRASYLPTREGDRLLAAVDLDQGAHEVRATFRGLRWANWAGGAAGLLTAVYALGLLARSRRWPR
jgi:hypothetical protein